MDIFGPLKVSSQGKSYVLTMTDAHTNYAELVPLVHKEAEEVADAFYERWICRFGVPAEIMSDNGGEFDNRMMQKICKRLTIEKKLTSPYHPH